MSIDRHYSLELALASLKLQLSEPAAPRRSILDQMRDVRRELKGA